MSESESDSMSEDITENNSSDGEEGFSYWSGDEGFSSFDEDDIDEFFESLEEGFDVVHGWFNDIFIMSSSSSSSSSEDGSDSEDFIDWFEDFVDIVGPEDLILDIIDLSDFDMDDGESFWEDLIDLSDFEGDCVPFCVDIPTGPEGGVVETSPVDMIDGIIDELLDGLVDVNISLGESTSFANDVADNV